MPLPDPSDYDRCLIVSGPYRNPETPDGPLIYEVSWIVKGKYMATASTCFSYRSAVIRAKRERTLKKNAEKTPIFTRRPSEDPILLKED